MSRQLILKALVGIGAFAMLFSTRSANAQNLLLNPGFENPADTASGNPGVDDTTTDWNYLADCERAQFYNHTSGSLPTGSGGSWSVWLKTFEPAGGGINQAVAATPGMNYTLNGFLYFESAYPTTAADVYGEIQFEDASSNPIGSPTMFTILPASETGNTGSWISEPTISAVAPAGATQVLAQWGWTGGGTVPGQQGAFVDDVSLTASTVVPEPASFALLGVIGAGLISRRRRH